jgi:hypothetical protein
MGYKSRFKLQFDSKENLRRWRDEFKASWGYSPEILSYDEEALIAEASIYNSCD